MLLYTLKATIRSGEESGFIAECVELPVVTQGRTLDETAKNLREAVALHLEGEDLKALGFAVNPAIIVSYDDGAGGCQSSSGLAARNWLQSWRASVSGFIHKKAAI